MIGIRSPGIWSPLRGIQNPILYWRTLHKANRSALDPIGRSPFLPSCNLHKVVQNCFLLLYHTQMIFQAGNVHESASLYNLKETKLLQKAVGFEPMTQMVQYSRFSHDVTIIQNKKPSILPRFYFHEALEQLKTNFHTNFRFKRVLGFVIEYA